MTRPKGLTDREWAVAERVGRGERTKAVADALHLSPRTVETHLASVYRKLGLASRSELVLRLAGAIPPAAATDIVMPQTQYVRSGSVAIAYQIVGNGPLDVLVIPGLASHVEMIWEQPAWRRFVAALSTVGRVIFYDKPGTGLSDPVDAMEALTLDQRMADARAVLDAAGSQRAILLGLSEGGPMSLYTAAADPERVAAVCVYGSAVTPQTKDRRRAIASLVEASYGQGLIGARLWPSLARTSDGRAWLARFERHASSPSMITRILEAYVDIDAAGVLDHLHVPVVVVHNPNDPQVPYAEGKRLAARLGVRLVPVPGEDHMPWGDIDLDGLVGALRDLGAEADARGVYSGVVRVLIALNGVPAGDRSRLDDWIRSCGGRPIYIDATLIGAFDSVGRALRCAESSAGMMSGLRIAVHAGEVHETVNGVGGSTVNAAIDLATQLREPGLLVSPVVQMLTASN